MVLEDGVISRAIIEEYKAKLLDHLDVDVALVGAGPSNLVAGCYLAQSGCKAAVFESNLAPGGGMRGRGGMMFNEIVIQDEVLPIVEELGISFEEKGNGYYTMDSIEATSTLIASCVKAGATIFNLVKVSDVLFRQDNGQTRVSGLAMNWSSVDKLDLAVDPLSIKASFVVDGTGHPAEICRTVARKMETRLNTSTGSLVGEMPLWADKGEQFTVTNTGEVFPGLYVVGMAANNVFGGPRMGPIFGGMLRSGKKMAYMLLDRLKEFRPS